MNRFRARGLLDLIVIALLTIGIYECLGLIFRRPDRVQKTETVELDYVWIDTLRCRVVPTADGRLWVLRAEEWALTLPRTPGTKHLFEQSQATDGK